MTLKNKIAQLAEAYCGKHCTSIKTGYCEAICHNFIDAINSPQGKQLLEYVAREAVDNCKYVGGAGAARLDEVWWAEFIGEKK